LSGGPAAGREGARQGATDARELGPCLVTGATGFIGGRLAARLAGEGRAVRCLARARSDTSRLRGVGVEILTGDLADPSSLARAAAGCTHVFHCAALVSDWATTREMQAANVTGTRNLLEACADARVARFVHVSSTDVYGHPGGAQLAESYTPSGFANWYAQSKREAEAEVRRADALRTVILRPATVYGPGSTEVVGEIARALRAGHMLLIDKGRTIAGLCYVENLIDAAMLALVRPEAVGHAFNISDGLPVTWRQFTDDLAVGLGCGPARLSMPYPLASAVGFSLEYGYRLLRSCTGLRTSPLLSRQAVQVLGVDQAFSTDAAHQVLGWEPRVGYEPALAATIAWLEGWLDDRTPQRARARRAAR